MAFDFSRINFLSKLSARSRILALLLGVVGIILLIYFAVSYFGGGDNTLGPSRVAAVPSGVTSVAGGRGLTAEYQRTLTQANLQAAEAARMSGTSAIPTQINLGQGQGCIICSDQSANVKNLLDDWVRQGKVMPDTAEALKALANQNVSEEEYAAALEKMVKDGKLTPEQARQLLDEYKKQHTNANLNDSSKLMDDLIKSGQLPLSEATQLLDAQKKGISTPEYAAMLQKMVRDGKITPAVAQQLLQQYAKQRAQEAMNKHLGLIDKLLSDGSITPDVAKRLSDLAKQNVSAADYAAALDQLVKEGKLTPEVAKRLLDSYRAAKAAGAGTNVLSQLLQQAENEAYQEISDLLAAGKISPETAAQLTSMIQNNVSLDQYKAAVNQMVQDKKLTPEIGQLKIGDYEKVKKYRDAQELLANLQANNASPQEYAEALKRLVAAGVITPEQAAQLMQEYQASLVQPVPTGPAATGAFGELQQRVAQGTAAVAVPIPAGEFAEAQRTVVEESAEDRLARIATLAGAMTTQSSQLIAAWQPPAMLHREGIPERRGGGGREDGKLIPGGPPGPPGLPGEPGGIGSVLIKGGTIIFGVLDTAINSDYPDSPIMVTVVEGPFKGARLLGKIITTKGVSGQMDRVSLNFSLMNFDAWPKSRSVTAYAIDPDTARTVMASSVDYHYMMRFGAMFATSFLQGYATAVTNQGTSTTGIFGTSTTTPALSPGNKIMVALGQVGQTLGAATQNYINRPPTVRVDSGVSLGILFMTDVSGP